MRAASTRPMASAAYTDSFHGLRFGDSAVGGDSSVVVVVVVVVPVSVVVSSDDVVSVVVVVVVVVVVRDGVVVVIGTSSVEPGLVESVDWFAICTTAKMIAAMARTPSTPAATTAVVV